MLDLAGSRQKARPRSDCNSQVCVDPWRLARRCQQGRLAGGQRESVAGRLHRPAQRGHPRPTQLRTELLQQAADRVHLVLHLDGQIAKLRHEVVMESAPPVHGGRMVSPEYEVKDMSVLLGAVACARLATSDGSGDVSICEDARDRYGMGITHYRRPQRDTVCPAAVDQDPQAHIPKVAGASNAPASKEIPSVTQGWPGCRDHNHTRCDPAGKPMGIGRIKTPGGSGRWRSSCRPALERVLGRNTQPVVLPA